MNQLILKKYTILSFGCQMNYADAERFSSIIEETGYTSTENVENTDLIILNTCSIRQKAEDRILGLTRNMNKLRQKNPNLKIILTGCMARRSWLDGTLASKSPLQTNQSERENNLKKEMPWVDFVVESKDFLKIPVILGYKSNHDVTDYLSFPKTTRNKFQAWIPISTGCDHFCSYCIVPFARGHEISRDAQNIITDTKKAVKNGFKDITLLGQTVNRWVNPKFDEEFKKGRIGNIEIPNLNKTTLSTKVINSTDSTTEPKDFLQLLQILYNIEGDNWLSFMSSHPNYLTTELIEFMAKSKHIKPYIHFAMQSGSDTVLKRMNRRYTVAEFISKTQKLKSLIPNLGLSTDIIVGYPGETESEFMETANVMKTLEFDMAYISEYSKRVGTASALVKDDIPMKEKTRRKKFLNDEILAKSASIFNQKMLNTIQKVLVEKNHKSYYLARTNNNKEVQINTNKVLDLGEFAVVKIISCTPWALTGKLL